MAHCFITDINKMCYQQIPSNFESPKSNFYFTVLANLHKTFIPPQPHNALLLHLIVNRVLTTNLKKTMVISQRLIILHKH